MIGMQRLPALVNKQVELELDLISVKTRIEMPDLKANRSVYYREKEIIEKQLEYLSEEIPREEAGLQGEMTQFMGMAGEASSPMIKKLEKEMREALEEGDEEEGGDSP